MFEEPREATVTIYDIARKAGVSPTTVSKALNDYTDVSVATRQKILEAAHALGYVPNGVAQALRTKRSWMIGVIVAQDLQIGPHFSGVLEHFRRELENKGYDVMFISRSLGSKPLTLKEHAAFRRVDGLLLESNGVIAADVLDLHRSGLPLVTTDNQWDSVPSINSANRDGSRLALQHLASLGHRKIGVLAGPQNTIAGRERYQSLSGDLAALGMESHAEWQVECEKFDLQAGYHSMGVLLRQGELPTAVLAASDLIALGAMAACREAGLSIPGDLSFIGFDDIEVAEFSNPALTTVRQRRNQIGLAAAHALLAIIDGGKTDLDIRVPMDLIVRQSCKNIGPE